MSKTVLYVQRFNPDYYLGMLKRRLNEIGKLQSCRMLLHLVNEAT
jgi:hypothetical protein